MWQRFGIFLLLLLLLLLLPPTANVFAQNGDVWGGRPFVGGEQRRDLAELLKAKSASGKSYMAGGIAQARKDYFASGTTPAARLVTEKIFADMLFEKDVVHATLFFAEGFSEASRSRSAALHTYAGGGATSDGGIRSQARREFEDWVNAVRKTLGAKSPTQILFVRDQAQLRGAMLANKALYSIYAEQRDIVEFAQSDNPAAREVARRYWILPEGMAPDGWARLHKHEVRPIHGGAYRLDLLNPALRRQLAAVAQADQQRVVDCTYGPQRGARGGPVYGTYTFWHGAPPPDIAAYLQSDRERALQTIGAKAVTTCPASEKAAQAARREAVAAHPWSEANRAPAATAPAPAAAQPKVDTTGMSPAEARRAIKGRGN